MATRSTASTRRTADTGKAGLDEAARLAGITSVFEPAANFGAQALVLQQALAGGLVRSQKMEAARLALRHGDDDPRTTQARSRAERLESVKLDADRCTQAIGHVLDTFRRDGTFSGYVMQPDGTPAPAHVVRIVVSDSATKQSRRGTAKTDDTGFFSITLEGDRGDGRRQAPSLQQLLDRLAAPLPDDDPAAPPPDGTNGPAGPSATTVTSRAEVLDASGRVVLEDPLPPTFDELASEFRVYVLPDKAAEPPRRTTGKTR